MLTFSEFKNILQLIASDDLECNILGQALARCYKFSHWDGKVIRLDKRIFIVGKNTLYDGNTSIDYEEGYQRYLCSNESRGVLYILELLKSKDRECNILANELLRPF